MSAQGIKGVLKLTISARSSAKSEPVFRNRVLLHGDVHLSAMALEDLFSLSQPVFCSCCGTRNWMYLFPLSSKCAFSLLRRWY